MKYHFCSCFDRNYLLYGMTLFRSLERAAAGMDYTLYVAALDAECFRLLQEWNDPHLVPIALSEIEAFDPEFAATRTTRSWAEYIFTLSPVLPRYLLARFPGIEVLNYLDADLLFFGDVAPVYRELGDRSLLIFEHRFPEELRYRECYGVYNVEFQLYRRGPATAAVLDWWRQRCLEWCFDRVEPERFADQKYLERWHEVTDSLVVAKHPGAGVAPWNWRGVDWRSGASGEPRADGQELIFVHFQGARFIGRHLFCHNAGSYGAVPPGWLRQALWGCYARELMATAGVLQRRFPQENFSLVRYSARTGFGFARELLSGIKHHNLMWIS